MHRIGSCLIYVLSVKFAPTMGKLVLEGNSVNVSNQKDSEIESTHFSVACSSYFVRMHIRTK